MNDTIPKDVLGETGSAGASPGRPAGRRRPGFRWPGGAGLAYLLAWIVGLAIWPANLALDSSDAQVVAQHRAHAVASAVQYVLVEGLAGVLFAVVLGAFAVAVHRRRSPLLLIIGVAAAISLIQCVLGLLVVAASRRADAAQAGTLFDTINRLDGAKMLSLAIVGGWIALRVGRAISVDASGATARGESPDVPFWMRVLAASAAVALAVSGGVYVLLASAGGWTVYVSGPLLLAWIVMTGFWLSHRRSVP